MISRFSQGAVAAGAQKGRWLVLGLVACSLLLLVGLTASSDAARKARATVILGQTAEEPDPSCPDLPCQAIGSVTGFQVNNGQASLPFVAPNDGKIKSWTLTLAQPTNSQRAFFNGFFGTPPQARLAILRRVPGTNPPQYTLRRQGQVQILSPYLGQTVRFSANLKVEKGEIVGLTVPTWAPAFAQDLNTNNVWRASRDPEACKNATDIRQGEPQERVGTRRTYGCKYTTARLLYTATLVETR
ncbi:MAG TPA: hypothetical protein VFT79_11770 [Solirubrobacterales bacterium]|nr:hypothetical protein [Solirubrobacterales bacterium]